MNSLVQGQDGNASYNVSFTNGQLNITAGYNFGTGTVSVVANVSAAQVLQEIAKQVNSPIVTDAVNIIVPLLPTI